MKNDNQRNENSCSDWSDHFDQEKAVVLTDLVVDKVISEIHRQNLSVYEGLSQKEIALLCRFPIFVATTAFIERLLRVVHHKACEVQLAYPSGLSDSEYFNSTEESVINCYYNESINFGLLYRLACIVGDVDMLLRPSLIKVTPRDDSFLYPKKPNWKNKLKLWILECLKAFSQWYVSRVKPAVIGEYSAGWMRILFSPAQIFYFDFPQSSYSIDHELRKTIRVVCERVLRSNLDEIVGNLTPSKQIALGELYADFIDHMLPISLVEGMKDRFIYYRAMIKDWNIKQVHSFLGYFYNENFKIFALLAKRKGAALIGHAHGINNIIPIRKHIFNELVFLDCYFSWSRENADWLKGEWKEDSPRIIPAGSVNLSSIKQWKKNYIDLKKITILYPSGLMMPFMCLLEEPTPEKNRSHQLKALRFLKEILKIYPQIHILYKPFPGTFVHDPIKEIMAEEFERGIIEVVEERPKSLYSRVDVVFWDFISTGFAESLHAKVPTLAMQSQYEYDHLLPNGKELNDCLRGCGIIFHDVDQGVRAFKALVNDLPGFKNKSQAPILKFQEAAAYPVSRRKYLSIMRALLKEKG